MKTFGGKICLPIVSQHVLRALAARIVSSKGVCNGRLCRSRAGTLPDPIVSPTILALEERAVDVVVLSKAAMSASIIRLDSIFFRSLACRLQLTIARAS